MADIPPEIQAVLEQANTPFNWCDGSAWSINDEPPEQEWTVQDRIPARQVCLLSGHGAAGKSTIALQLCAAHALARDWLTCLPEPGPSFFLDAEDDIAVVHRRLHFILKHYGVDYPDAWNGGLHLLPLAGKNPLLATADRTGKLTPTKLFDWLLKEARRIKPKQIVIASVANVWTGNENDRSQTTQFIDLMTSLAIEAGGSVIPISHPSLQGLATNSGISGSTQWHNAVRSRMYLKAAKEADDEEENGLRKLEFKKNQYGPTNGTITLEWKSGLFLPLPGSSPFERAAREQEATDRIRTAIQSGQRFSPSKNAKNYPPSALQGNGLSKVELKNALDRMLQSGRWKVTPYGPASRGWEMIVETDG
jgi:RecA-family ATPase